MTRAAKLETLLMCVFAGMDLLFATLYVVFGVHTYVTVGACVLDYFVAFALIVMAYKRLPSAAPEASAAPARGRYYYRTPYERYARWHDVPREEVPLNCKVLRFVLASVKDDRLKVETAGTTHWAESYDAAIAHLTELITAAETR